MSPYALRPWYRVHASSIALVILALIFFLLAGCTSTTPPAPVTITAVSLAGIERPVRRAVRANEAILTHAQRQQVLLAEAEAILARYPTLPNATQRTFVK